MNRKRRSNDYKRKKQGFIKNLAPFLAPMWLICAYKGVFSAPLGARTLDPNIKSVVLYQLS